jgi:nucleoside-triphosphatase
MSIIPKIGITGLPRVGKTEGLLRVVHRLEDDFIFGGMITVAVKEDGKRTGFKIVDWMTKEEQVFAHINFDTSYRIGKYHVDLKILEGFGITAIKNAVQSTEVDIVIIDEIGRMELESKRFKEAVRETLDSQKPVLVTLHKKSRDSLLQDIRNMNDVRILEITPINRNLIPYKIEKLLKEEWQP